MSKIHSSISVQNYYLIIIISFTALFSGCKQNPAVENENISQWRGINRDGIYPGENLMEKWPGNGPDLLWKFDGIGKGYAAPAVTDDKIFVNGETDSLSYLFAFDLSGNLLWKSPNGKEFMGEGFSATYPGSRSTPTVIGDLVYTSSGEGRIACVNAESGMEIWAVDIINDLKGLPSFFGYSESVLVDDDKLFCFPGGKENNTVALNRFTGETIWSADAMLDTFSYCSPISVISNNVKTLVTHSRHHLYALNCNTGALLDAYKIEHYEYDGEHCNSPVFYKGDIYFIGNEKEQGAVKIKFIENGEKLIEAWRNPAVKNNFNGYVVTDDKIFTTIKGNWLKALDINSGEVVDSLKVSTGSIIFSDSKFICYGMNGEVNLVDYSTGHLTGKGSFKVQDGTGHHFAHPVVAGGVLYIRHGNSLMAYDIAKM